MCAIIGALVWAIDTPERLKRVNDILNHIMKQSHERGRDGRGFMTNSSNDLAPLARHSTVRIENGVDQLDHTFLYGLCSHAVFISNLRAETTTEYVADKRDTDQQPYYVSPWTIVHNGTIANDKDLRTFAHPTRIDSAAIAEHLASAPRPNMLPDASDTFWHFYDKVRDLKGSYAILANCESEPNQLLAAANYRPIWYVQTDVGVFLASARHYFPDEFVPKMLEPYSAMSFLYSEGVGLEVTAVPLREEPQQRRALVVCSGGLDSVVAATYTKNVLGYDTELIHFRYGSRAEGPEVVAVQQVADALGVRCTVFPLPVYKPGDSPLLQADSKIAGGEEGAEFAHEWIPARNLLLLSVATAYAEANGFDTIVLGNNLEEAGAYPDNEPEFIAKFNDLLPFAVGDGKHMRVIMPVGNLMKHEIVALGHKIGAPLDKTWSCYRAGEQHCGTCGPCYMRRTAFEINHLPEVITYANEKE